MQNDGITPNTNAATNPQPIPLRVSRYLLTAVIFTIVLVSFSTLGYLYGLKGHSNPETGSEVDSSSLKPLADDCSHIHFDSLGSPEIWWEQKLRLTGEGLIYSEVNWDKNIVCNHILYKQPEGSFLVEPYYHKEAGKFTVIETSDKNQTAQFLIIDSMSRIVKHRIPIEYNRDGYYTAATHQYSETGLLGGIVFIKLAPFPIGCSGEGCENIGNINVDEGTNEITVVRTDGKFFTTEMENSKRMSEGSSIIVRKDKLELYNDFNKLDNSLMKQLVLGQVDLSPLDE